MDARDQLRRYLEQRREMGERELVLDGMSVEEVMRILGARPAASVSEPRLESPAPKREAVPPAVAETSDWREVLRGTGSAPREQQLREPAVTPPAGPPTMPPSTSPPSASAEPVHEEFRAPRDATAGEPASSGVASEPPTQPADAAPGLVVGTTSRDLFGGPLSTVQTVDEIAAMVAKCTRCPLYKTALNPVPGEGSATAELVCVGEAPGQSEDETGRPFVGAAGQLLTKILAAINLRREDVFFCNVLKHRPPLNRNPMPQEVEACSPYLVRQLEIIRPKVIVAFGTFAAQTLLDTKLSIGKLRGTVDRKSVV